MKFPSLVVGACLAGAALQVSASEFNGTIKGSIDGHAIDVKAVCSPDKKPWDWLQVVSDPGGRNESLRDRDGDGIAITVGAARSMGGASFEVLVAGKSYKFGSTKRSVTFSDKGFKLAAKFSRTEGADRKVVSSYQADLAVECKGI